MLTGGDAENRSSLNATQRSFQKRNESVNKQNADQWPYLGIQIEGIGYHETKYAKENKAEKDMIAGSKRKAAGFMYQNRIYRKFVHA